MQFTIKKKDGTHLNFESTLSLVKSVEVIRRHLQTGQTREGFAFDLVQAYESNRTTAKQELWLMKLAVDLENPAAKADGPLKNVIDSMAKMQAKQKAQAQLRLHGLQIKRATRGRNTGGAYVYTQDGYAGLITPEGHLRGASDETASILLEAADDVVSAARTYGRDTGACSVCGRPLTDPVSIWAGIGPVCMERLSGGHARKALHDQYMQHHKQALIDAF